jgi:hypothetical protein
LHHHVSLAAPVGFYISPMTCNDVVMVHVILPECHNSVFAKVDGMDHSTGSPKGPGSSSTYRSLKVKAGTLVVMHDNMMHTSEATKSDKGGVAYVFGVLEGSLFGVLPW